MTLVHRFKYHPSNAERLLEVEEFWRRRHDFLPGYCTDCRRRFGIGENALIIANHLVQATAGGVTEWAGPGLLPERLTRDIEAARRRPLPERTRPETWEKADGFEQQAGLAWATDAIQDAAMVEALRPWCPDLIPQREPDPEHIQLKRLILAQRVWPQTTTLVAAALIHLHDELVAPLRPALPTLVEVLASQGWTVQTQVVTGVLWRWRHARFTHVAFSFVAVRRVLRDARARHRTNLTRTRTRD